MLRDLHAHVPVCMLMQKFHTLIVTKLLQLYSPPTCPPKTLLVKIIIIIS